MDYPPGKAQPVMSLSLGFHLPAFERWSVRYSVRYVVGILSAVLATIFCLLFAPVVSPFTPFLIAVMISAWFGGLRPGVLTSLLAIVILSYLFVPLLPGLPGLTELALFMIAAAIITTLNGTRRRAEKSARAQREQLRVTLASIGDGVIVTDARGQVTFLNAVAEALTSWKHEDAVGADVRKIFNVVNEHTRQPVESPIMRVLRDGLPANLADDTILIARDGVERPIDDSGAPIRDGAGKTIGAILVFRDVTARHEAETALRRSEERLRLILGKMPVMLMATDDSGNLVVWNDECMHITGYHADEMLNNPRWAEILYPDPACRSTILAGQDRRDAYFQEIDIVCRDGSVRTVAWSNISGQFPIPGWASWGIGIDISERKSAEARTNRLQAVTAALSEALTPAQVADVVLNQAVPALGASAASILLLVDNGAGLESIATTGNRRTLRDDWRRVPIDAALPIADAARTGYPIWLDSEEERTARYPHVWVAELDRCSSAALPLIVNKRVIGAQSLRFTFGRKFSDEDRTFMLTLAQQCAQALERARLYETERRARADAELAIQARDEFLTVAAHELRTPLTSLRGFAQLIMRQMDKDNQPDPARVRRTLEIINDQSVKLSHLITQLLDLSRIQSGRLTLELKTTDIVALVESAVAAARMNTTTHTICVSAPASLKLHIDALRLEQVVTNLLDNAIKYSPDGGPIEVEITAPCGGYVSLSVSDHGIGVPPEHRPYIFERFFQAHKGKHFGGLGLGLYISRQILELHGGQISAEFPVDGGTRFVLSLPA